MNLYETREKALQLALSAASTDTAIELILAKAEAFYKFLTFHVEEADKPEETRASRFSAEQAAEILGDVDAFVDQLRYGQGEDRAAGTFYPHQRHYIWTLSRGESTACLSARGMGITTALAAYLLWRAAAKPNTTIVYLAPSYSAALVVIDAVHGFLSDLDPGLAEATTATRGKITLKNGSSILGRSFTSDCLRGLAPSLIAFDNASSLPHSKGNELPVDYLRSMCSQLIVQSAAGEARGYFYDLCCAAQNQRSPLVLHYIHWSAHPARNKEWAAERKAQIGEAQFASMYGGRFLPPRS